MFLHSIYLICIMSFHYIWYMYIYCEIFFSFLWMNPFVFATLWCIQKQTVPPFLWGTAWAMPIKACLGSVSGRKRLTQRVSGLEGWKVRFVRFSSGTSFEVMAKKVVMSLIRTDEKPVDDKEHRRRNWDPWKIDEGMKLQKTPDDSQLNGTKLADLRAVKLRRKKNGGSSWTAGRERYNFTTWTPISIGVIPTYNL